VAWNVKAFESLVVEGEIKELIEALVINQLVAEKSTDLIAGKGNGLIILLHGYNSTPLGDLSYRLNWRNSGPGMGKTLTAGKCDTLYYT